MGKIVTLDGVRKSFGKNEVLKHVSLDLEPGRFYALLGSNGAGKSTLMRILMRQETLDAGRGEIAGIDLESDDTTINEQVGYVSEAIDFRVPGPLKSVFAIHAQVFPRWNRSLFAETVAAFGLDLSKNYLELSRGQKMQLAFCAAFAIQPKLLLLDEITSVLDANARGVCMAKLSAFARSGGTVLLATNIVSEVHGVAEHLVFIEDGSIRFCSPVEEVAKLFVKLRKSKGVEHACFDSRGCVPVGVNPDGSLAYLTLRDRDPGAIPEHLVDPAAATPEQAFIFLTHKKAG